MENYSDDPSASNLIKKYDERGKLIEDHKQNQEDAAESDRRKFGVPPGLVQKVCEFHALIEVAEGKPILITGPTGVGKSLFLHMVKEWHK